LWNRKYKGYVTFLQWDLVVKTVDKKSLESRPNVICKPKRKPSFLWEKACPVKSCAARVENYFTGRRGEGNPFVKTRD
jgi:hypothetical protein